MSRKLSKSRNERVELGISLRLGASGLILVCGVVLATLAATATLASAKETASELTPDLLAAGWRLLRVPGKDPARFTQQGPDRIGVQADKAVGFLHRSLDEDMDSSRRRLSVNAISPYSCGYGLPAPIKGG